MGINGSLNNPFNQPSGSWGMNAQYFQ